MKSIQEESESKGTGTEPWGAGLLLAPQMQSRAGLAHSLPKFPLVQLPSASLWAPLLLLNNRCRRGDKPRLITKAAPPLTQLLIKNDHPAGRCGATASFQQGKARVGSARGPACTEETLERRVRC